MRTMAVRFWFWCWSWVIILEGGIRGIFMKDVGFWEGIKFLYEIRYGVREACFFAYENCKTYRDIKPLYNMFMLEYIKLACGIE